MLRKASITKLFGIYSYAFDLVNEDGYPLRFITGPNGYGKTTLLNLINALMTQQYKFLYSIEFEELKLMFDVGDEFSIHQHRVVSQDDASDKKDLNAIILNVVYTKNNKIIEQFEVVPEQEWGGMTEMFFQTYPLFYINDKRNIYLKSDFKKKEKGDICTRLEEDTEEFRHLIEENVLGLPFNLEMGESITKDEYLAETQALCPQIHKLKRWGLIKPDFAFLEYFDELSPFLRPYVESIRVALRSDFVLKIELFETIIKQFAFANKHLEINPEVGFFFAMDDGIHDPLTPEELSSGEQHILLQVYELIFAAPKQSLVLIDEPELSAHMYWQMIYSQQIEKIAKVRKLQCIIATHSPQVFNQIWEHTVNLYRLAHPKMN